MKRRILTIVGARPQFIKAMALSKAIKSCAQLEEIMLHTGQHYDFNMSDIFFKELGMLRPKYSLNIGGGRHGEMTGKMLKAIEDILLTESVHAVVVFGDTNSTLAGALAAKKLNIPIAHVESGLRSFNKKMPEEVNRILTDHISDLLFCPTKNSILNLKNEGIVDGVHNVGDIMFDAVLLAKKINKKRLLGPIEEEILSVAETGYALLTIHRQESTANMEIFCNLVNYACKFAKTKNLTLIFPAHPRLKNMVRKLEKKEHLLIYKPFSYLETQLFLSKAKYVLTDSGGLQKESYFHKVPCITLRAETEWMETIKSGWNRLWQQEKYLPKKYHIEDYGLGDTSIKIAKILGDVL
jgi:UDP-GlcNAc3NAcA epimerase